MEPDLAERMKQAQWTPVQVKAFAVPEGKQGWRGQGLPSHQKRKVYTVLHDERVLVSALLKLPGDRSVAHSHENGDLSIHFNDPMAPIISWHPPGEVPGGRSGPGRAQQMAEIIDIIFPQFNTTIEDPRYLKKTVVGQWYD